MRSGRDRPQEISSVYLSSTLAWFLPSVRGIAVSLLHAYDFPIGVGNNMGLCFCAVLSRMVLP